MHCCAPEIIKHREIFGHDYSKCHSTSFLTDTSDDFNDDSFHSTRAKKRKSATGFTRSQKPWTDAWRDFSKTTLRLDKLSTLSVHNGCVNSVVWSPDGRYLLSGSDDRKLVISDPFDPYETVKQKIPSGHKSNVFSARFLPGTNNQFIVSCSSDGTVILTDVERPETYGKQCFTCHVSNTYEVGVVPEDPFSFLSCGEDGTVRLYDRRVKTSCGPCKDDVILDCHRSICALDIHPLKHWMMVVGCSDSSARLYDMRMLSKPSTDPVGMVGLQSIFVLPTAETNSKNRRITSVDFSPDGNDLLISFSSDFVYLYKLHEFSKDPVNFDKDIIGVDDTMSVKRVRLRGDWSDTGPQAMPEPRNGEAEEGNEEQPEEASGNESGEERDRPPPNILQRFGGLLTRWFERQLTEQERESEEHATDEEERETEGLEEERREEAEETENTTGPDSLVRPGDDPIASMAECSTSSRVDLKITVGTQGTCSSTMRVVLDNNDEEDEQQQLSRENTSDESVPVLNEIPEQNLIGQEESVTNREEEERREDAHGPVSGVGSLAFRMRRGLTRNRRPPEEERSQEERDRDARRRRVVALMEEEAKKRQEKKREMLKDLQKFPQHKCVGVYRGHRNARTMLKQACFWGRNHIMSGSDCGHFFVWDRHNAKVEMVVEADKHVVNCLQPHPTLPILATSGIDYDIKLWAPIAPDSKVDLEKLKALMKRNDVMLAETRDTVTIPAAFMIRMIANMNRVRNERRRQQLRERMENEEEEDGNEETPE